MRVLVVTKIFPNALEPASSPFNRQQFAALSRLCDVEVLATIPWFPGARAAARWSPAGRLTGVPRSERIDGLDVAHPRYLFVPRVAPGANGLLYAGSIAPEVLRRRGTVDVLLGSWAYPDGFAIVLLGRALGLPTVVKLHGSDMNVVAEMPGPARALRWALPRADRVVAVSRPLAERAAACGVPRERIALVENGVDTRLFHVRDRAASRERLGLSAGGRLVLFVGRLEREKGAVDLLRAFARVAPSREDLTLAMVGGGRAEAECRALAAPLGDRVRLVGPRPLEEVAVWMGACDVLVLPSWNEGTPNVVIEALASGRRVVATRVGGIPDLLSDAALGELVPARDDEALGAAIARVAATDYAPDRVAALAGRGDWAWSAARLHEVLLAAAASRRHGTIRPAASGLDPFGPPA